MADILQIHEVGTIREIKRSVAKISGLANCMNGQLLEITPKIKGMVLGFAGQEVSVLLLGAAEEAKVGDKVYSKQESFKILTGEGFLGRVVNALAQAVDGKGPVLQKGEHYPVFRDAPGILERSPLAEPFETGILAIDATIAIGKGQRELIIGDRMLGKSSLCIDTIINQKDKGVVCVYCCIGRSHASLEKTVGTLKDHGAMDYTMVVSATASSSVGDQYLAPYTACTLGEYFMDRGRDVFVVFDDLSKHAWAYRQISLLLERSPGRDAYPGDVFYLHSQLMERAGKLNLERRGGSMTFFPIAETVQGDFTGYIPSNLVSMTDGQIYLSAALFSTGLKPAIDLGLSVSRLGNKVQSAAMKELSAMLRLEYIQYQETLKMTRLKTGVSEQVNRNLRRGEIITQLFIQDKGRPYSLVEELFLLYALRRNILDVLPPAAIEHFKKNILKFTQEHFSSLVEKLRAQKTLTHAVTKGLDECLTAFFKDSDSQYADGTKIKERV
ncbi:MAG: F0F1 ATP synthase subunit alpha [Candidatus Omnitrophica bacterium]|nr:F0F1 ATP synthase subunit alpha [Candidatus Omnitrophota bacterium]